MSDERIERVFDVISQSAGINPELTPDQHQRQCYHLATTVVAALDEEPLEDVLAGIHPHAWLNVQGDEARGYIAMIQMPKVINRKGRYYTGAGRSRESAIRQAVQQAKEQG